MSFSVSVCPLCIIEKCDVHNIQRNLIYFWLWPVNYCNSRLFRRKEAVQWQILWLYYCIIEMYVKLCIKLNQASTYVTMDKIPDENKDISPEGSAASVMRFIGRGKKKLCKDFSETDGFAETRWNKTVDSTNQRSRLGEITESLKCTI